MMLAKLPQLTTPLFQAIIQQHGTPCWVYDFSVIQKQIEKLRQFDVIRFAQKSCSNIHVLQLMRTQGVKVDSVSLGEVERALKAGYVPQNDVHSPIVFTADLIDKRSLQRLVELGVPVNCGSIDMIHQIGSLTPNHAIWLRINPGFGHGHSKKTNTGGEHSKHGIWHEDLQAALAAIEQYQHRLMGLHMHIGSGVDYTHLQQVCEAMVKLCLQCHLDFPAISIGGGLSIPYQAEEPEVDTSHYFSIWQQAKEKIEAHLGHRITMEIEPGRYLIAQAGALISEVRAIKNMGHNRFVMVDAGFNDLARPALYGSYHHMRLFKANGSECLTHPQATVVAGPLCESGDVFTQNSQGEVLPRYLADCEVGDYLVFEDAGAYGASMSSNYNSRPLIPEIALEKGQTRLIRRRQTWDELMNLESC